MKRSAVIGVLIAIAIRADKILRDGWPALDTSEQLFFELGTLAVSAVLWIAAARFIEARLIARQQRARFSQD